MFELFMYMYSYCNALSAGFFAVDRALNSYFMIMIMINFWVIILYPVFVH